MRPRISSDTKSFTSLEEFIKPHEAKGRTESAAFLIWFLQTIYRLDDIEAQDAVCDRKSDAGIDALAVNDEQKEIVLFQAKRKEKLPSTLGDSDLKSFTGAIVQFQSEQTINHIAATTVNTELKRLIESHNVADKIAKGYTIRPIFIANIAANVEAKDYILAASHQGIDIDLWDLSRLRPVLDQLKRDWFVDSRTKLPLVEKKLFIDGTRADPRLVFAAVKAKELVKLPGIQDTRVFAQNVRLSLGPTRVNNEILESVKGKAEHTNFLTFHNGLTIVAQEVNVRGNTVTMNHYSVCNGCQSLMTFFNNRRHLTDDLEVLVRIVRVGTNRKLSEYIAYRTNNQNPISLRDLSANNPTQVSIKSQFDELYGHEATYGIKRGDKAESHELPNEYAGQLLLALYAREPWSAHQKYRVFGDLESKIFVYGTGAPQVRLAQRLAQIIEQETNKVAIERVRKYGLTKFLVIYFLGEVLRLEADGKDLLSNPERYLSTRDRVNPKEALILDTIRKLAAFIIIELNYHVEHGGGENYDYKVAFKSPTEVKQIRAEIMKAYEKDKYQGRLTPFALPK